MTKENYNIRIFIIYGILFEVMTNMYKPFGAKFLERIGGTDFHITLLNSLPGLITIFALIPGALYLSRKSDTKKATTIFIFFSRLFLLTFALVPFIDKSFQPMFFVVMFSLMNFPNAIYLTSYQSFTGDIFSEGIRSRAIGQRNKYTIPALMITTLVTGQLLSNLPKTEAERMFLYQIFYIIAFVIGVAEVYTFNKFKSEPKQVSEKFNIKEGLVKIFSDKKYMGFFICSLAFHAGWQMGWPLFNIYMINVLGADELWLAIISISSFIAMFIGHGLWPKWIEKYSMPTMTAIATLGMAVTPILYAVSKNLYVLTVLAFVTGLFTSGTITLLFGELLDVTPSKDRVIYISIYNTFINLSLAISPFLGHFFLSKFNIFIALYVTAFVRLIGGMMFFIRNKKIRLGKAL